MVQFALHLHYMSKISHLPTNEPTPNNFHLKSYHNTFFKQNQINVTLKSCLQGRRKITTMNALAKSKTMIVVPGMINSCLHFNIREIGVHVNGGVQRAASYLQPHKRSQVD